MVHSFKVAWETGALATLMGLHVPDVTAITDGGGVASAALVPLLGTGVIAESLFGIHARQHVLSIREELSNGEVRLVATGDGGTLAVISL